MGSVHGVKLLVATGSYLATASLHSPSLFGFFLSIFLLGRGNFSTLVDKLRDWSEAGARGSKGALVEVEGEQLAVFKYGNSLLATAAKCPHVGGPLHLGDIEVLPDKSLCLKCPNHRWTFQIGNEQAGANEVRAAPGSGSCTYPRHKADTKLPVYPVRRDGRMALS